MGAGCAILKPLIGQPAAASATGCTSWNDSPSADIAKLELGTNPSRPPIVMPPPNAKSVSFEQVPPPPWRQPRPLWSQLLQDAAAAQRVKKQIIGGYNELLRRSSENPMDPTGLLYQTWIHSYYCSSARQGCDLHTTWLFLPWHRAFTYFHERILAHTNAINDPNFRLPVWDWENRLDIPPAYDELKLPCFLTGQYERWFNDDKTVVDACSQQAWLLSTSFTDFCGNAATNTAIRCQAGPHNAIHTYTVNGAMSKSITAAADPLFYAHHANIDRFWTKWLQSYSADYYASYKRPSEWLNAGPMYLYDECRQLVMFQPHHVLHTKDLGYEYDSLPDISLGIPKQVMIPAQLGFASAVKATQDLQPFIIASIARAETTTNPKEIARRVLTLPAAFDKSAFENCLQNFKGLPVQITGTAASHTLQPGKYYVVLIKRGTSRGERVGGFGVFGHLHDGDAYQVAITACLSSQVLHLLFHGSGNLSLVYGAVDPNTGLINTVDQTMIRFNFTVLIPPDVTEKWKAIEADVAPLLKEMPLHFL